MVRMKQQGRAGKYMCRFIVYSMWEDAEQRGKVMGVGSFALFKNTIYASLDCRRRLPSCKISYFRVDFFHSKKVIF